MTDYAGDFAAGGVAEAHDVLAGHPVVAAQRGLTCRWPQGRTPHGIVVFCHGLGSDGAQYAPLSRHWAQHGYLVIHPTFADSITAVAQREPQLGLDPQSDLSRWAADPQIRPRMHEILHAPDFWLSRIELVRAVMAALPDIAWATAGDDASGLPCAIAGHSFGAYTAQLLAGAEIDMPDGTAGRFRDGRFGAAIILSGQGRDQQGLRDGSWDGMDGPVLTVTGTLDRGAKGGDWRWKSEPFELAPAGDKYLAVLDDGDHFLGGLTDREHQAAVPAQREAVRQITLAFLDAHIRDDATARAWLRAIGDRAGGAPLLFMWK